MELEKLGHGGRAADVPHGLPGQGRPVDLPGGGMPSTSGDKDGDVGKFYAPACPGHRVHFGGRKDPPPTSPPMQHADPLAFTERKAPCHHTVRQESGVRRWQLAEDQFREITERAFEAYGTPLENVTAFKYMGRVTTAGYDDWPAVLGNLQR